MSAAGARPMRDCLTFAFLPAITTTQAANGATQPSSLANTGRLCTVSLRFALYCDAGVHLHHRKQRILHWKKCFPFRLLTPRKEHLMYGIACVDVGVHLRCSYLSPPQGCPRPLTAPGLSQTTHRPRAVPDHSHRPALVPRRASQHDCAVLPRRRQVMHDNNVCVCVCVCVCV